MKQIIDWHKNKIKIQRLKMKYLEIIKTKNKK